MRRMVATGGTDVGRVREGNEDSFLVAESVFAVADGMGGHLAGEIASATALGPVEALDGKVFADADDADEALRRAIVEANEIVSRMAEEEPAYRGMGTTLTAAMLEGRRLHVAHVGDSRAYLLRDDKFSQLTDDHTLVQHLIDAGQITRREAASHPQRSIITRAIGVARDVEVDSMTIDVEPGDQVLLCSDGLTGVLEDEEIAEELRSGEDPEHVIQRLIQAANARGGPDNITLVLLRCDPDGPDEPPSAKHGGAAAAAGTAARGETTPGERRSRGAPVAISTRDESPSGDWAGRLGNYGSLGRGGPGGHTPADEGRSRGWVGRLAAGLLGLAVLAAVVFVGGRFLLSQQYFVGLDDEQVVIYQGVDFSIGTWNLARVVERTDLTVDDVPAWYRPALEDGIHAPDRGVARRIVAGAPRRDEPAGAEDGIGGTGIEEEPAGAQDTAGDPTTDTATDTDDTADQP
ncbi:Stp1/IreP family PP2C-type Ser/Thr phosphatase [Egicoccus sp. AB-alg2]|uniref:Stp1/IreP family PP2C-type Ser/Thr phosphatase n=1 Tax=Egicoccus sp. AB-alg2 TaxID=3242693 RepID=UPI00359CC826